MKPGEGAVSSMAAPLHRTNKEDYEVIK